MMTNKAVARKIDGVQEVIASLLKHELENEENTRAWLRQLSDQIQNELNKEVTI